MQIDWTILNSVDVYHWFEGSVLMYSLTHLSQLVNCVTLSRTTLWERELLAMNGVLPILTPMITYPICWLRHFHMVRRERSSARCYCTTYEFGEQQGCSNPHGIWTLFAVGEYENGLTYNQFSGCVPLIWWECFNVLVDMCESTHRSCESTLRLCKSTFSMR